MWIEEFETFLLGEKPTPEITPLYVSKIGLPVEWGSKQVKEQYESGTAEARASMDRAIFKTAMSLRFGDTLRKVEVSESWTGKELTLREEREIPDFRFWIQLKDRETSDPKAVLFALDWHEKPIKRRLPDNSETEAIYLWHLFQEQDAKRFRQFSMYRAEYGYYLDFRYYTLRRPGQQIMSTRNLNGTLNLEALALEEPGMWVHWKIREPRAEELRKLLRSTYFTRKSG